MKILVTGSSGYIGRALVLLLVQRGFNVSIAVRQKTNIFPNIVNQFAVGDFKSNTDFLASLAGVDCVVHLAGKAHTPDKDKVSALDEFRKINTELTLNLAKQAVTAGVKRIVFLSSIGVNGNQNYQPFLETDIPNPQEPYAISKYEAEQGLLKLAENSGLEVVLIRPPLVYGNNAPGNFGRLLRWVNAKHPMPLPFGSINNSRSLVALDNLVDFIILCTSHKKAVNEVFLLSDGDDLSTTQLLQNILKIYNKKALLIPISVGLMSFVLNLIGKKSDAVRLFSTLRVDSSKARDLLEWRPIVTMKDQLKL